MTVYYKLRQLLLRNAASLLKTATVHVLIHIDLYEKRNGCPGRMKLSYCFDSVTHQSATYR